MLDDQPIGVLAGVCRAHGASSREADVALAQSLTAPAVAAVRNAALYAEALARLEEIQAFQRVASETLSSPELETALARWSCASCSDLLRSDAALCTLVDSGDAAGCAC